MECREEEVLPTAEAAQVFFGIYLHDLDLQDPAQCSPGQCESGRSLGLESQISAKQEDNTLKVRAVTKMAGI
jgi:hypothetical protein